MKLLLFGFFSVDYNLCLCLNLSVGRLCSLWW